MKDTVQGKFMAILCRCGNTKCNYVFVEDEMIEEPSRIGTYWGLSKLCPECRNGSYFIVDKKGFKTKALRYHESEIDMRDVSPSGRLSSEIQDKVLECKARFLQKTKDKAGQ